MKYVICYISNVNENLEIDDIKKLLRFCERNNKNLDLRGLLLYSEGNFFQVIEGEKEILLPLWETIRKDSRHYGIIQVLGKEISQSAFDGFTADVVGDENKYTLGLPNEYTETIEGMSKDIQRTIKNMLGTFISTRA